MLFPKTKIHKELSYLLNNSPQKNYRVIIKYSNFEDKLIKKIISLRGTVLNIISPINCLTASLNRRGILKISEFPFVKKIICDKMLSLNITTSNSSGVNVRLPQTNKLTGVNVSVGIISSGVYPHADLLKPHNKIIRFMDLVNSYSYPYDDFGHGTALCGLISGSQASSGSKVLGLSPESHIYMIKAFNSMGKGYISSILHGLNSFVIDKEKYNIRVICLPFEMDSHDNDYLDLMDSMFKVAKENNIVVVVPSSSLGTEFFSTSGFALSQNCITIGGLNQDNTPYKLTSTYKKKKFVKPDFWFPCVDLNCLNSNIKYVSERAGKKLYPLKFEPLNVSATSISLASALVSSLIALAFQYDKNFTWSDIYSILKYSSLPNDDSKTVLPIINIPDFFQFTKSKDKHKP